MTLALESITEQSRYFDDLKRMRKAAFGSAYFSDEKYAEMRENGLCEQLILLESGTPTAFMTLFTSDEIIYLFLLAVDEPLRSRGYGSAALSLLAERYRGRPIVIDMDELDSSAPDYEKRLRRYDFYKRNGYALTNMLICYYGKRFELLSAGKFDLDAFKRLYKRVYPPDFQPSLIEKRG